MSGKMVVGISIKVEGRYFKMSIEQIKKEIWYYAGRKATTEEAEEILGFIEDNPEASLDEIISEYYSC
jgi:hypothetical protein